MLASPDELESLLRNAGLSKRAAEAVAARGFDGLSKKAAPEIDATRVGEVLRRFSREIQNWK